VCGGGSALFLRPVNESEVCERFSSSGVGSGPGADLLENCIHTMAVLVYL